MVFYNSYLPLMVDDSVQVMEAKAAVASGLAGEQEVCAAQERVGSEYSSRGMMWGYIGGTVCIIRGATQVHPGFSQLTPRLLSALETNI